MFDLPDMDEKGRYIVTQVSYALTPGGTPRIEYADLKKHFAASALAELKGFRHIRTALLSQLRVRR